MKWHLSPLRNSKLTDTQIHTIHKWLAYNYGKANKCESDSSHINRNYQWSNLSGEYKRDRNDFIMLCISCHKKRDLHFLYGHICRNGHTRNVENIYRRKNGTIACRECRKDRCNEWRTRRNCAETTKERVREDT